MNKPLAERLRPQKLEDYLSQQHLVGDQGALQQQIKRGILPSIIFWGPPGVGKTTLANIIANESQRPFFTLSAISSGVKDVREVIEKAKRSEGLFTTKNPILLLTRSIVSANRNRTRFWVQSRKDGSHLSGPPQKIRVSRLSLPFFPGVRFMSLIHFQKKI